ncbi:uncharacterized protein TNCT_1651 [Trichonephila clavata]|uniref:C2H2-type domain-containing protein n=1 Tax=Trichonephila clavata TaxID=2740835 RepID=A0A8X6HUI3_TRICU|nr:uncharacterized protein TNCT_1651 [Trichonephila clavata]
MPSKLKAWLKAKLGFGGSSIPYKEFKDEQGSTSEEFKVEPMIYYNCDHCGYRSSTQKGLRSHLLTCHKIGVGTGRTLDAYGHAAWTQNLVNKNCCGPNFVISASICVTCHVSGCLDYKSGNISHCLDTIKCIFSTALQRLFGLQVWSYQPLPGYHQVYLQHCTSVAVWTASLVISAPAWTPSSVSPALQFSGCLDYKSGHISHCLDTIKCI